MIEDLSINRRKQIAALHSAKRRREAGLFVAEGSKSVLDLLDSFSCEMIVATAAWLEDNDHTVNGLTCYKASRADMERITALSTAPQVAGVFRIPEGEFRPEALDGRLVVALDGVQDPGNLGTIIRCCDWFGVDTILCSHSTVDVFNPKVIQSTMGAIGRVKVFYIDLPAFLSTYDGPKFGTFLDGSDIYGDQLPANGIIVMGNEGNGISDAVAATIGHRLYIPPYPTDAQHVESLNVSMATAITLAEFRRQTVKRNQNG